MVRRPLLLTVCILTTLFLLTAASLWVFGFCLPAQFTETFLGELPVKMELLRAAPSPRIIFVGGSSVPFGLKSPLLQAHFPNQSIVDLGLYADIGTPVMLDLLEEELREGDTVIIMPEQDPQALSPYFSGESLWQAMDGAFGLIKNLESHRYERLAASYPAFAGKKCYYTLFGSPKVEGIYARASFDAWGDISSPLRDRNIMAGGFDPNQLIRFDAEALDGDFVALLNNFAALCREKGAQVYYRFPPMNRDALAAGAEEQLDDYYDHLNASLSFPILGDPHRSILESGWFYDTNFHLNESGATVFTKDLIEDLKILFRDTSVTDLPLPPMPAPESDILQQGDNSCAHLFSYRKVESGWVISGLREQGLLAKALTVPVCYQGEPVIGIDDGVFQNCSSLEELTLQTNIRLLPDGMFRGCGRLKKLVLTGSPSDYTVGDGLREGADFMIFVSPARLDSFRRHYSWQKYSPYILS